MEALNTSFLLLIISQDINIAYPTHNETAKTAATHLYNDSVLRFSIPSQSLHDQGEEFENVFFKYLANLLGIQNLRTTPYHPETSSLTERS